MNSFKRSTLALAGVMSITLSTSVIADEMVVKNYAKDLSGNVVKTPYGECWRTPYKNTTNRWETCGYKKPVKTVVVVKEEIVIAPNKTAGTVTIRVAEDITIRAKLLFDFDSAELSGDAKSVIDERIEKFRGRGELTRNVSVTGHTDSTGSESYNQELSERRARIVADYLEQNTNITDDQIDSFGEGESNPTATNSTKEGRAINRRVNIHLEGRITK